MNKKARALKEKKLQAEIKSLQAQIDYTQFKPSWKNHAQTIVPGVAGSLLIFTGCIALSTLYIKFTGFYGFIPPVLAATILSYFFYKDMLKGTYWPNSFAQRRVVARMIALKRCLRRPNVDISSSSEDPLNPANGSGLNNRISPLYHGNR